MTTTLGAERAARHILSRGWRQKFRRTDTSRNVTRRNRVTRNGRHEQYPPAHPGRPPKNTGVSTGCEYHTEPPRRRSLPSRRPKPADLLGLSRPMIYKLIRSGQLRTVTIGRHASRAGDRARATASASMAMQARGRVLTRSVGRCGAVARPWIARTSLLRPVLVALARSSGSCRLGRPEVVVFEVAVVRPIAVSSNNDAHPPSSGTTRPPTARRSCRPPRRRSRRDACPPHPQHGAPNLR